MFVLLNSSTEIVIIEIISIFKVQFTLVWHGGIINSQSELLADNVGKGRY